MTFEFLCECIRHHPSASEVLEALRTQTVCTGLQCFETDEDAYSLLSPSVAGPDTVAVCAAVLLGLLGAIAWIAHAPPLLPDDKRSVETQ